MAFVDDNQEQLCDRLVKYGSDFLEKHRKDKVIDGPEARYTSRSYARTLFDVFEAGRMGNFEFTSDAEGAAAEGFVIHYARSKGLRTIVWRSQTLLVAEKARELGPLTIQAVSILYC